MTKPTSSGSWSVAAQHTWMVNVKWTFSNNWRVMGRELKFSHESAQEIREILKSFLPHKIRLLKPLKRRYPGIFPRQNPNQILFRAFVELWLSCKSHKE